MNHNDIRHMLSEYIDGAVLPGDRAAIEEHLKTCEKCSEALKELRQTVAHIRSVEELDPPAWMTQKIMAKVRDKAGKKSWFQRLFFPLHIKLPLEAIGVLFIAMTALFIYENMQPSMKASRQQVAEQAPAVIAKNEEQRPAEPSPRSKEIPQSPGYKALDMKQEYEKPAPPTLQGQAAAPAPSRSKPEEQPEPMVQAEKKQTYTSGGENAQDFLNKEEAPASGMTLKRAVPPAASAPEATRKAKSAVSDAPIAGALTADKAIPLIIIQVLDTAAAGKEVEKAIAQVHGSIVRRETPGSKMIFFVMIKALQFGEFKEKLKLLGEVREQPGESRAQQEQMALKIELIRKQGSP